MLAEIGLKLSIAHVVIIVLSVPLILKKVKRNRFYGFRVPKTLASDEVWYPANAMAGRAFSLCAVVGLCIVQAAVQGSITLSESMLTLITMSPFVVASIYSLVRLRTL